MIACCGCPEVRSCCAYRSCSPEFAGNFAVPRASASALFCGWLSDAYALAKRWKYVVSASAVSAAIIVSPTVTAPL